MPAVEEMGGGEAEWVGETGGAVKQKTTEKRAGVGEGGGHGRVAAGRYQEVVACQRRISARDLSEAKWN